MNRQGSPPNGQKKRPSASANLKESPSKVRKDIERDLPSLNMAFSEFCGLIDFPFNMNINLPLFKVYQYVESNESSTELDKREIDMSTSGACNQQSAGCSNLEASVLANSVDSGMERQSSPGQASGSSNNEDSYLCLPQSFVEDIQKLWTAEYNSLRLAQVDTTSFNPPDLKPNIREIVSLFKQLVYLEVFVVYNPIESEKFKFDCRIYATPTRTYELMAYQIQDLDFNMNDFDAQKMINCTYEEFKSKVVLLWEKEEIIMYTTLELTKFFLNKYFLDKELIVSRFPEFTQIIEILIAKRAEIKGICYYFVILMPSVDKLDLLKYYVNIHLKLENLFTRIVENANYIHRYLHCSLYTDV